MIPRKCQGPTTRTFKRRGSETREIGPKLIPPPFSRARSIAQNKRLQANARYEVQGRDTSALGSKLIPQPFSRARNKLKCRAFYIWPIVDSTAVPRAQNIKL